MLVIKNNILPLPGFVAVNLFGLVFVRKKEWEKLTPARQEKVRRHEAIHTRQMVELLIVGFYLLYRLEWAYWMVFRPLNAYRHISFEREAYAHESKKTYLQTRRHYAQWRKAKPTRKILDGKPIQ